jgi:hypothetical protein
VRPLVCMRVIWVCWAGNSGKLRKACEDALQAQLWVRVGFDALCVLVSEVSRWLSCLVLTSRWYKLR